MLRLPAERSQFLIQPILVAERFKARVCGRLLAGVVASNPAGDMDDCVVSKDKEAEMHDNQGKAPNMDEVHENTKNPAMAKVFFFSPKTLKRFL